MTKDEIDSWCERIVRNNGDAELPQAHRALAEALPEHMGGSLENACWIIAAILYREHGD